MCPPASLPLTGDCLKILKQFIEYNIHSLHLHLVTTHSRSLRLALLAFVLLPAPP